METPDVKHLVFAILEFFDRQLQSPNLSSDAKESLEGKLTDNQLWYWSIRKINMATDQLKEFYSSSWY